MKLYAAPLQGFTEAPWRNLHQEVFGGIDAYYTPFVRMEKGEFRNKDVREIASENNTVSRLIPQLIASTPAELERLAGLFIEKGYKEADINMGCPVKKVVSSGDGSALMKNPDLAARVAEAAVKAVDVPVTVKMRTGWDSDSINVVDFAKRIESTGVAAIAVHGRTKEQMYSGHADWSYIKAVKEAVSVPVMGNGDIVEPEDAKRMLDETGCDAVMVGRGAQGNPWIFDRIHHYLATGEILPAPTDIERLDMLLKHFDLLCQYKGESMAVKEIRTHAGWYMKGLPESAYWRNRVNTIHTVTSFHNEIESYRKILSKM